MVVAPFRQWRITARTSEQQNRPGKTGRFFVSSKSETELRRALLNPNPCATSPDGRPAFPSPVGSDRSQLSHVTERARTAIGSGAIEAVADAGTGVARNANNT